MVRLSCFASCSACRPISGGIVIEYTFVVRVLIVVPVITTLYDSAILRYQTHKACSIHHPLDLVERYSIIAPIIETRSAG